MPACVSSVTAFRHPSSMSEPWGWMMVRFQLIKPGVLQCQQRLTTWTLATAMLLALVWCWTFSFEVTPKALGMQVLVTQHWAYVLYRTAYKPSTRAQIWAVTKLIPEKKDCILSMQRAFTLHSPRLRPLNWADSSAWSFAKLPLLLSSKRRYKPLSLLRYFWASLCKIKASSLW